MKRLALFVLLLCAAAFAAAHDLNITSVRVVLEDDDVLVSVQAPIAKLGGAEPKAAIADRLQLQLDGRRFEAESVTHMIDEEHQIVIWQGTGKGSPETVQLNEPIFDDTITYFSVFRDGQLDTDALVGSEPPLSTTSVIGKFIYEGIRHIMIGPDHILFVIALLLLGGSLVKILKVVTAFTIAHSITLSLAATGVVHLSGRIVEPIIAFSIIAVAVENLRPRKTEEEKKKDYRVWIAFGFGLIHGFGFAGVLAEVGLPRQSLAWALASFNIGVEIGQAAIVVVVAPLLALLAAKREAIHQRVVVAGSICVALAGAYWLFERIFAG